MLITKISKLTGIEHTKEINVTQQQLYDWALSNQNIQDIMPQLSDDEREFIMTGITSDEWDDAFPDEGLDEDCSYDDIAF